MREQENKKKGLKQAVLSLSLLTVMAGAAVAPALNVIQEYFSGTNPVLVRMIISIPALFIAVTNLIFPKLCKHFGTRTLLLIGLALYVVGGSIAGLFSNIYLILAIRALVGVGVGIIMPMSTGLIAFYFPKDQQDRLMGYSSAMNQLGGSVATLIAGLLAAYSWRLSFLVYLLGLLSVVLCLIAMPNDRLAGPQEGKQENAPRENRFTRYYPYIIAMAILMFTFFIFPSSFAEEAARDGVLPQTGISVVMALMDAFGFVGGLIYAPVRKRLQRNTAFFAPMLFIAGYAMLAFVGGWVGSVAGAVLIGLGSGSGIPYIISSGSAKAGSSAATTVLPLISAALYIAQFVTPFVLSAVEAAFPETAHVPFIAAICAAILLLVWGLTLRQGEVAESDPEEKRHVAARSMSESEAN